MKQTSGEIKAPAILKYILPSVGEVLSIAIFLAVIGLGPALFNMDGDLGRHITIGKYILDTFSIPKRDIFSHTLTGNPLTPHEWLAQVLFAIIHQLAGFDGLVFITALLIAGTFWIVYNESYRSSKQVLTAAVITAIAAASSSLHWLIRPHIFTLFFVVIWKKVLDRFHHHYLQTMIGLSLIMLMWVNIHGAFLVGIMVWLMYLIGDLFGGEWNWNAAKKWLISGVLIFVVSLCNPVGFQIWKTGFGFLGNRYLVSHTAEYLPPNFQHPSTWPFLLMLLISIFVLGLSDKKIKPTWIILITGWTAMGLYSARNIPLYSVIAAPSIASVTGDLVKNWENVSIIRKLQGLQFRLSEIENNLKKGFWAILVIVLLGASVLFGMGNNRCLPINQYQPEHFPASAVDWIEKNQLQGNMFNYFPWGGYLLYRMWPEQQVFIDGQTDFYGENLTREYERVITLSGDWEEILSDYRIDFVIMPTNSLLIAELSERQNWSILYQDDTAVIIRKSFNAE